MSRPKTSTTRSGSKPTKKLMATMVFLISNLMIWYDTFDSDCNLRLTGLQAPISNMILESMESQGLPLQPDMFTTGDSPHGCGHAPRTVYKGDRTTAANYFVNKGPNLAIKTEMTVDKVILEGHGSDLRATAVKVIEKDGSVKEINARKEIIVSGGAYCSPTILLRSGIGPKEELASHGIDCKIDLPGVGKNLMDHLVSYSFVPASGAVHQ